MLSIDLNCDMGEGTATDTHIMPYISSVNIACGYHAGNADTMKRTIELALEYNVAIGAHPGFNDKENFGRTAHQLSKQAYYDIVAEQLQVLQKYIDEAGTVMHHVKPHGALYNMSAKDAEIAATIASAVKAHNPGLILYGLSKSFSLTEAGNLGLKAASEVFADRTYTDEGNLTPRSQPNAFITSSIQCVQQVMQIIRKQSVTSTNNKTVPIKAETICIHGDGPHAVVFTKKITFEMHSNHIAVSTFN